MLKTIIEKEIRDNLSSVKFILTFSVCALLILLSFFIGAKNYQLSVAKYEAGKSENLRQLEGLTDWLAVREYRIYLPPNPLESLVTGVSNDIGRTVEVSGRGELYTQDSRYGDEPIFAIFRFLDLEFIFQVILSLFAILFAYDAINGEKEKGTLRLIFSNSVPRDIFISGKLIGTFFSLIAPLLIPVLIGILLFPLMGVSFTGDQWLRFSLIILSGFLYAGTFLTLSVFISAITEKSSNSFLILLAIWIFAVMIFPRLSIITAGRLVDVPPLDEMNSKKARFISQLWQEDRSALGNFKPGSDSKDIGNIMKEFNKFMQDKTDQRDKKIKEYADRLNEQRNNKEEQMQKLSFNIARLSPASSFSFAVSELANTSLGLQSSFKKSIADYQLQYANFIISKTGQNPGGMIRMVVKDDNEKPKPINPREIPEFKFTEPAASQLIGSASPDIGLLLLYNIIFFAGAFLSFRKFDLR